MIDIKAIKAAAEAATPQPWIDPGEGNMPFICMMTPATVIALCDEIESLRQQPSESGICPTCGSACNERDELIKAEREIERLRQQLAVYEKHGVTCQTFGHKLTGCAECNRDDAAEPVNETNAVLANNYLALVPEIERHEFHISILETDNAVFKQEIESLREQIGAYQLHEKQLLAAKMGLECKVDRLRADAARYQWLEANSRIWSWNPSQYNKHVTSGFAFNSTGYSGYPFADAIGLAMKDKP